MVRIKNVLNVIAYGISLLGFIPLFPFLEMLPRVLFPLAFAGGIIADKKKSHLPGRVTTVISLVLFLYYAARFHIADPVAPAVNLLVILLAVRLANDKNGRNYLQIFALSLFSLASSSLYNLGPVFLIYLLTMLVLFAISLVLLTFYGEGNDPVFPWARLKSIIRVAAIMPVAALPLMLVFFIILPRTQVPLMNFLNRAGNAATGFSETVQPGVSASVSEVKNIVFRATCDKLPQNRLYWRGIVLNSFTGRSWSRQAVPVGEQTSVPRGESITQTIYPEPGRSAYLFALNVPVQIRGVRTSGSADYVYNETVAARRVKYEAVSVLVGTISTKTDIDRDFYLRLPPIASKRLRALAKLLANSGKSDADKVALLEKFYRDQKLSYATTRLPTGTDPLDEFLFVAKRGHCEFFASSCALLLRLAGVPARLVAGYFGGHYNELGGYYVVSEDMAHVWVEVYLSGRGWVALDPSSWAVNFAGAGESREIGAIKFARMYLDALGYFWNRVVITYDLEKQVQLLHQVDYHPGRTVLAFRRVIWFLLPVLAILVVAVWLFMYRRRAPTGNEKILKLFFREVARLYPHDEIYGAAGIYDLADRLENPKVREFVHLYGGAIYRDRPLTADELEHLRHVIREMKACSNG
jgi:transglutaminase-like putative cysteine protease